MPLPRYCRKCEQRFQPYGRYNFVCNDCYDVQLMTNRQRKNGRNEIKRLEHHIEDIRFNARIHPLMRLERKAHCEMMINAIRHSITSK